MSAVQSFSATSLDRRIRMLRTAMGPVIAAALEDPDVVEIMLNPDRTLWVDRLSSGRAPLGVELSEEDGERIIRLAQQRGRRVILARNLLGTLRNRELAQAAKDFAAETGLEHRPVVDGQRVAGIYQRSVMLASGRYAMLDDGMEFSLVPWRPVIEQRLGQHITATVRGSSVSWEIGRSRGPSVG